MRFGVTWQTDTASVLWEAIGYIKFLQEQVQVIALLNTVVMFIYILNGINNHCYKVIN